MLTLLSVEPNVPLGTVQVDDYIPLSVEWGRRLYVPAIYWRTGNLQTAMLELGIEVDGGQPCSITLVAIEKIVFVSKAFQHNQPFQVGFPLFALQESWEKERYIDDKAPLTFTVWQDMAELAFAQDKPVAYYVQSDNVWWGIGEESQLASICVRLDAPCLNKLKQYQLYSYPATEVVP